MPMKPGMIVDYLVRNDIAVTEFPAAKTLIREGSKGTAVYVLFDGEVSITKEFSEIAVVRDRGAMLGEIAALLDIERTATVTTVSPCSVFVIENLQEFIDTHPTAALAVLRNMAQQIIDRDKSHPGVYIGLKRLRQKNQDF